MFVRQALYLISAADHSVLIIQGYTRVQHCNLLCVITMQLLKIKKGMGSIWQPQNGGRGLGSKPVTKKMKTLKQWKLHGRKQRWKLTGQLTSRNTVARVPKVSLVSRPHGIPCVSSKLPWIESNAWLSHTSLQCYSSSSQSHDLTFDISRPHHWLTSIPQHNP